MPAKRKSTITLKRNRDGSIVQVLPGGRTRPYDIAVPDLAALDRLSDAELTARAANDPDNPPVDDATLARMAVAGRVKAIRVRSSASQAVFSARYGIPIGTLRDWEYGRRMPDAAAMGFLRVIDLRPKAAAVAMTTYSTPEDAYEYLKNATELLAVGSLQDLIGDVLSNSPAAPALLDYVRERQDDNIPVSQKLYLNTKIAVDRWHARSRRASEVRRQA